MLGSLKGVCEKKFFWKNFFGGVDFFGGVERGWGPPYPPPLTFEIGKYPPTIISQGIFVGRILYLYYIDRHTTMKLI